MINENRSIFIFKNKYLKLNLLDKVKIKKHNNTDFCKINNELYHYKVRTMRYVLNELLGENVSMYFGLDTVQSIFMRHESFKEKYILLTKIFEMHDYDYAYFNKNTFPNIEKTNDVGLDNLDKLDVVSYKGKIQNYNVYALKYNLKKMIVRDFITNQTDRHEKNFLFKINKSNIELLPLFDYEYSFYCDFFESFQNLFNFDLNSKKVVKLLREDEDFQLLLIKAMEMNIDRLFEKIEDEYPVFFGTGAKEMYKDVVLKNQNKILEYKLIK